MPSDFHYYTVNIFTIQKNLTNWLKLILLQQNLPSHPCTLYYVQYLKMFWPSVLCVYCGRRRLERWLGNDDVRIHSAYGCLDAECGHSNTRRAGPIIFCELVFYHIERIQVATFCWKCKAASTTLQQPHCVIVMVLTVSHYTSGTYD